MGLKQSAAKNRNISPFQTTNLLLLVSNAGQKWNESKFAAKLEVIIDTIIFM